MSAIRFLVLLGCMLLFTACGGGGGGSDDRDRSDQTQSSDSGNSSSTDSGDESSSGSSSDPVDSGSGSAGDPLNAGDGGTTAGGYQRPAVLSLWSEGVAFGEGRIIDDTIGFSGTAQPRHVIEFWLNDSMSGSTVVDSSGEWSLDFTPISLVPDSYEIDLVSIAPNGDRVFSSRPFIFRYDPTAPAAPIISGISDDAYIAGDGVTTDGTIVVNGTAEPNTTVTVYLDGVAIGNSVVSSDGSWQLDYSSVDLADGTYLLTADTTFLTLQSAISPQFSLTVDRVAPVVPTVFTISDDSGISNTDAVTNDTTLLLSGLAEPDSRIQLRRDGVVIGSAQADVAGTWIFDFTSFDFADGVYGFTLSARDLAGNDSPASVIFPVEIDTQAPAPASVTSLLPDTGIVGDGITATGAIQIVGAAEPGHYVDVLIDGASAGLAAVDGAGNWSLDLTSAPLANGLYSVTTQVMDVAGNLSAISAEVMVIINNLPPAAPVITGVLDDTNSASDGVTADTTLVIVGSADVDTDIAVFLDGLQLGTTTTDAGGNWTFDYTATSLADGAYIINAMAENQAGLQSVLSADFSLMVDTLAPSMPVPGAITADSGVAGDFITSDTTLIFDGLAEAGATVEMFLNGTSQGTRAADGTGAWSFDLTGSPLTDGVYTLVWRATDEAGNLSAPAGVDLEIDTQVPPAPVVTGFSDDTAVVADWITSDTTLVYNGTAEANGSVEVFVDGVSRGTTMTDTAGNWSFDDSGNPLSDGAHLVTAYVSDVAANVSTAAPDFAFTVDATAPAAPIVSGITDDSGTPGDGVTSDNRLIISGTAETNSTVTILVGGSSVGTVAATAGSWTFDYTSTALADGSYVINAVATDTAGNVSPASASFNLSVDTVAPAAPVLGGITDDTNVAGDGVTNDSTLTVNGNSEAGATISVYLDGLLIGSPLANAGGDWTLDYTGTILADGAYTLTADAMDAAGNLSLMSSALNVQIDTAVPVTPAITSISTDSGTADGVTNDNTLIWNGSAEPGIATQLFIDSVAIGTAIADGLGNWTYDYSAVSLADGAYILTAQSTDLAGNISALSVDFNINVDSVPPPAPVITALSDDTGVVGDAITSDATLLFSGSSEADATIDVYLDAAYLGSTVADNTGIWSYDYSANVLTDGDYLITATATDLAGNTSAGSLSFPATVDSTAPLTPVINNITDDTGVAGDGITSDNRLIISGTGEANASVEIFSGATSFGVVSVDGGGNWSLDNTAIALADGNYTLTAVASDVAGNTSPASGGFTLTLDTGVPTVPAVLGISSDTGTAGDGITADNTLLFSGNADADSTVDVYLDGALIGSVVADGGGNWSLDYSATTLSDGSYAITASARDSAGNASAASSAFNVVIDSTGPVLLSTIPADGAVNAGLSDNLILVFDEPVTPQSGNIVIYNAGGSVLETVPVGDARVTGGGSDTITVNPNAVLVGGSGYYIQVTSGAVADALGNGYSGIADTTSWNFTSEPTALLSSVPADEATGVALNATLNLTFNEQVSVASGFIRIRQVSDNSIEEAIDVTSGQVIGSGTASLSITLADVLVPNTNYYVEIEAGALTNNNAVSFGGVTDNTTLNFTTLNATIPSVLNVTSTVADGTYRAGDVIPILVQFSEAVTVDTSNGSPQLYLDLDVTDRYIRYVSGSGSDTLLFSYTATFGDSSADLSYVSTAALELNGATLRSDFLANAELALPVPGDIGSLSANKAIVIIPDTVLDVSDLQPKDGFFIEGAEAATVYFAHSISSGGDFNGDGFEDIAIGVPDSNLNNTSGGYAYLVYGQSGATRGTVSMSAFNSADGVFVSGAETADYLGGTVNLSGDLNDDGYDDMVVAVPREDDGETNAGALYIIWGSASPSNIDISTDFNTAVGATNAAGFVILGNESADEIGHYLTIDPQNAQFLDAGGDFNGDGVDDLLIGHNQSDFDSQTNAGVGYLVFGRSGSTRSNFKLDTYKKEGFAFYNTGSGDNYVGHSVQFIGDYNGDGYNDVIIGAPQADGGATDSGEAYVVFGNAGPEYQDVDLAALNGINGFTITSADLNSKLGGTVSSADVNGDGLTDVIIGATEIDINGLNDNGAVVVLYGNTSPSHPDVVLESVPAGAGYIITGENDNDRSAFSVRGAGDVNGDGVDDFMISTIHDDDGGVSAGAAWIIFGLTGTSRGDIDLLTLSASDGFKILGDAAADQFGRSATAGDVNGDGYRDMIFSSVAGDNAGSFAGEVNVIWGKDFWAIVEPVSIGDAGLNNLVGSDAADVLVSNGGLDALSAGAGNDIVQIVDTGFFNIDGGRGLDSIQFTSGPNTVDLTALGIESITGIEIIDLADNGNSLVVSKRSVLGLSKEGRSLFVQGGSSDAVTSTPGDAWAYVGTRNEGGINYNVYLDSGAILYVQTTINSSGVVSFASTQTYAFNTTGSGAGVSGNVTDFPVLIRISNSIRDSLQADWDDIRFTDRSQLVTLSHELEVGASGELYAWVMVPQIDGNSTADYITMHYDDVDNDSVPNGQYPRGVWYDYAGVWHFDESSGNALDTTVYQNHGVQSGTISRPGFGVGRGAQFNNSSEQFLVSSNTSLDLSATAWTFMVWHDFPGCTGFGWNSPIYEFLGMGTNFSMSTANVNILGGYRGPKADIDGAALGGLPTLTFWIRECDGHLALTYDPAAATESRFYWGGGQYDSDGSAATFSLQSLVFGNTGTSNSIYIDEARIATKRFSADYIKLTSENQTLNSLVTP